MVSYHWDIGTTAQKWELLPQRDPHSVRKLVVLKKKGGKGVNKQDWPRGDRTALHNRKVKPGRDWSVFLGNK